MNRPHFDAGMEKFMVGAATFLLALLALLVIGNASNEKCPGGWRLLEIPCHTPEDDYPPH